MKVAKAIIVMFFYNSLRVISSQESIEDPSSDNVDEHENAYSLVEEVEDERLHELSPDLFGEDKQDAWEDLEQKGKNSSLSSFKASDFSDQDTTKKSRATMIKQQAKKMGLNVEELKQLLYDLQEDEEEKRRKDFYSTTFEPQYEQDDRTLLDVFGEAAKGYLTQNMIPDTDAECRWDWRRLQCESACDCELRFERGDYHLGRACRLRKKRLQECDADTLDPIVGKRLASLIQQTIGILLHKMVDIAQNIVEGLQK